jgi:hypothetical protein
MTNEPDLETGGSNPDAPVPTGQEPVLFGAEEFTAAFGEPLARTLDLDTWKTGENLEALYDRLEVEVKEAVRQEDRIRERVRREVFPRLGTRRDAPREAGIYQATVENIERVHRGLLFNGNVEACDGTSVPLDTLPVTIIQIGVCLVSYQGDQGSWVHRLYRRDLRVTGLDPVEETLRMLERRQRRAAVGESSRRDALSDLGRRGIMAYAERAVLLHKSQAPWRLGHGNPTPYELLTGSGMRDLLERSLDLLNDLVLRHKRFVFVPSAPAERMLLTLGNALLPLEYAIIDHLGGWLQRIVDLGHYRGDWAALRPRVDEFIREAGSKVVVGAYRASRIAPAQLFYAHVDHAHEAALIAMADSALQEHRGFPMLIELADTLGRAMFGADSFNAAVRLAYTEAGEPFRYLSERQTRRE